MSYKFLNLKIVYFLVACIVNFEAKSAPPDLNNTRNELFLQIITMKNNIVTELQEVIPFLNQEQKQDLQRNVLPLDSVFPVANQAIETLYKNISTMKEVIQMIAQLRKETKEKS
jgi:hypothetical protein